MILVAEVLRGSAAHPKKRTEPAHSRGMRAGVWIHEVIP